MALITARDTAQRYDNESITVAQMEIRIRNEPYAIHLACAYLRSLIDDCSLNSDPSQVRFKAYMAYAAGGVRTQQFVSSGWDFASANIAYAERAQYYNYWIAVFRSPKRR